jgi:hypothetical protein
MMMTCPERPKLRRQAGRTKDAGELARYRDMGVARVVPMLLSEKSDKILPILDRWAEPIRRTAH